MTVLLAWFLQENWKNKIFMKAYIFRTHYNLGGLINANFYEVCTERTRKNTNRRFLTFEKRDGKWLLWTTELQHIGAEKPQPFNTKEQLLKTVENEIMKQIELKTGKKPDEIQLIGLKKILEN